MSEISDERATLEAILFSFFARKYVQEADERQKSMGLTYTSAETHDLAKEVANFIISRERFLSSGAEAQQAPTDYSNLLSVITEIRERSGVGSKPMLSELADAIAERIAEPKVGDEVVFCPQCGWNSAMDAAPGPQPAGTVTEGLVAAVENLLAHWDRHDGPEKRGAYLGVGYWSPAARMVDTQFIADLRAAFAARPAEPVAVKPDPWVDTRLVRFDDTIVFGHGGFDFDRWESLRWEMHTPEGSWAVWKSGNKSWSLYGGPNGLLALDRYGSEEHAKADAEQAALSTSEWHRSALVATPAPGLVEALRKARAVIQEDRDEVFDCVTVAGVASTMDEIDRPSVERMDAVLREIDAALAYITETGGAKE